MRTLTVSEIMGHAHGERRDYPREGSLIRAVYDRLAGGKGRAVFIGDLKQGYAPSTVASAVIQLREFYGCDIRRAGDGHYILCGEWFGSHYSDYVVQAIDAAVAQQAAAS